MLKKKNGFTLTECVVCFIMLSSLFSAYIAFNKVYVKNQIIRDEQLKGITSNIDRIEQMRETVNNLDDLFEYEQNNPDADIYLVGAGKCTIIRNAAGKLNVQLLDNSESGYIPAGQFSPSLFRVEYNSGIYTRLSTIIYVGGV